MTVLSGITKFLKKASYPIRSNFCFFFFMYLIGIVVSYAELPTNRDDVSVYGNIWLELFFDLYIICVILSLIPKKLRCWYSRCVLCNSLFYQYSRSFLLGEFPIFFKSINVIIGCRNR